MSSSILTAVSGSISSFGNASIQFKTMSSSPTSATLERRAFVAHAVTILAGTSRDTAARDSDDAAGQ
jgi:hypothetical protein